MRQLCNVFDSIRHSLQISDKSQTIKIETFRFLIYHKNTIYTEKSKEVFFVKMYRFDFAGTTGTKKRAGAGLSAVTSEISQVVWPIVSLTSIIFCTYSFSFLEGEAACLMLFMSVSIAHFTYSARSKPTEVSWMGSTISE